MTLSEKLRKFILKNGAKEVGFADISGFSPKPGLNTGIVFYLTYPKEIIRSMENAPTQEYLEELISINSRLDDIGMKCENFLIDEGYEAYAQTKKRLGGDYDIQIRISPKAILSIDRRPTGFRKAYT